MYVAIAEHEVKFATLKSLKSQTEQKWHKIMSGIEKFKTIERYRIPEYRLALAILTRI